MPTIAKGSKVLVSGANGYIAIWVVRILLERSYAVRGTVRSVDKGKFLSDYFASLGYGDSQFETVVVEDIVKDGAFDEAVKGVDAIEHLASPFHLNVKEPDDLLRPAVQGTIGMLKSALKNGAQVKRVVVTSSSATIMSSPPSKPTVFSEDDWDLTPLRAVEEHGSNAALSTAAWEFHENHKNEVQWDLTVIIPPYAFGPPIHNVTSLKSLHMSLQMWYHMVISDTPKSKEALSGSGAWVDVRDIALGHVLALEKPEAGGQRIVTTSGPFIWQEWVDATNSLSPSPLPSHKIPKGFPEIVQGAKTYQFSFDKSKEQRILGIKFHTLAETTKGTLLDGGGETTEMLM